MALTFEAADPDYPIVSGSRRVWAGTVTFDDDVPVGGEVLDPAMLGLSVIDHVVAGPAGGTQVSYVGERLVPSSPGVAAVTETFAFDDFTDNADDTGFVDFSEDLPAGALVLGWSGEVSEGFTGDTSAVAQVGVSGDLDRFSADTSQSVFASGTVGSAAVAADAASGIDAAATPRLTVTSGSDFGDVDAGEVTVSVLYVPPASSVSGGLDGATAELVVVGY